MPDFLPYHSYPSPEAAAPLLELLRQHGIPFETHATRPAVDPTFAFNPTTAQFVVKLHPADLAHVRTLEEQASEHQAATLAADADHYLHRFSDAELTDILVKPDEWSAPDVALAGHLLRQRGHDVSAGTVQLLRQHRRTELAQPETGGRSWIVVGYISALLGGLVGLLIGIHLYTYKKRDFEGRQLPGFTSADRLHGLRIIGLGVVSFVFWLAVRAGWL